MSRLSDFTNASGYAITAAAVTKNDALVMRRDGKVFPLKWMDLLGPTTGAAGTVVNASVGATSAASPVGSDANFLVDADGYVFGIYSASSTADPFLIKAAPNGRMINQVRLRANGGVSATESSVFELSNGDILAVIRVVVGYFTAIYAYVFDKSLNVVASKITVSTSSYYSATAQNFRVVVFPGGFSIFHLNANVVSGNHQFRMATYTNAGAVTRADGSIATIPTSSGSVVPSHIDAALLSSGDIALVINSFHAAPTNATGVWVGVFNPATGAATKALTLEFAGASNQSNSTWSYGVCVAPTGRYLVYRNLAAAGVEFAVFTDAGVRQGVAGVTGPANLGNNLTQAFFDGTYFWLAFIAGNTTTHGRAFMRITTAGVYNTGTAAAPTTSILPDYVVAPSTLTGLNSSNGSFAIYFDAEDSALYYLCGHTSHRFGVVGGTIVIGGSTSSFAGGATPTTSIRPRVGKTCDQFLFLLNGNYVGQFSWNFIRPWAIALVGVARESAAAGAEVAFHNRNGSYKINPLKCVAQESPEGWATPAALWVNYASQESGAQVWGIAGHLSPRNLTIKSDATVSSLGS